MQVLRRAAGLPHVDSRSAARRAGASQKEAPSGGTCSTAPGPSCSCCARRLTTPPQQSPTSSMWTTQVPSAWGWCHSRDELLARHGNAWLLACLIITHRAALVALYLHMRPRPSAWPLDVKGQYGCWCQAGPCSLVCHQQPSCPVTFSGHAETCGCVRGDMK